MLGALPLMHQPGERRGGDDPQDHRSPRCRPDRTPDLRSHSGVPFDWYRPPFRWAGTLHSVRLDAGHHPPTRARSEPLPTGLLSRHESGFSVLRRRTGRVG